MQFTKQQIILAAAILSKANAEEQLVGNLLSAVGSIVTNVVDPLTNVATGTATAILVDVNRDLDRVVGDVESIVSDLNQYIALPTGLVGDVLHDVEEVLSGVVNAVNSILTPILEAGQTPDATSIASSALSQYSNVVGSATSVLGGAASSSATPTTLVTATSSATVETFGNAGSIKPGSLSAGAGKPSLIDELVKTLGDTVTTVADLLGNVLKVI